ncbi:thiamine-monophosphate kinase [Litchfieldella qijiaojingensis]|uniref:Thiamine-monophosphate kinase n=1 Tax=Litchfieldella qijiaojingensis TaxID=980347 RepID=A0ABQ2YKB3_9GAMM|nr:thiamine-phosphate kinase [Halomonas qijiaojingensis]GGX87229.1 thiamine-monophosphate kinase [Halomonas qijiaojingensis]
MPSEFELIARYFTRQPGDDGVLLGVGDDCTLLQPTPGYCLAVSVDTSVADVHFPGTAPAYAIGYRALAVSLSDLAAMGATPRWCLMALTLPEAEESWLAEFARGFHALCDTSGVTLAGGDITCGDLSIGVTVHGELPPGMALRRSGARAGDVLAVTGSLGGGHGGLRAWQQGERDLDDPLLAAYLLPQPRIEAGQALRDLATAAIDISDGLLADLQHLCEASGVGAELDREALPLTPGLVERLGDTDALHAALGGGDDYELLVSLPPKAVKEARRRLQTLGVPLTVIGKLSSESGIRGVPDSIPSGWLHFHGEAP